MSRKYRKTSIAHSTATAARDDGRHLHAVTDDPGQQDAPTTEDKVRAALTANPGSTTAKLARTGGIGRSTAAKVLARWDRDGTATRTAGDGPRNPDTWTLAPSTSDTTASDTTETQTDTTRHSTDQPTDATDVEDSSTKDAAVVPESKIGSDGDDATAPHDRDGDIPPPETAAVDPADAATESELSAVATSAATEPEDAVPTDKERLPKGGLRALVEKYLTEHADESFGPAKIGKELSRSGGAVNNALEKLVADGYATQTCEAPKRFAVTPVKTDVPEAIDGSGEPT